MVYSSARTIIMNMCLEISISTKHNSENLSLICQKALSDIFKIGRKDKKVKEVCHCNKVCIQISLSLQIAEDLAIFLDLKRRFLRVTMKLLASENKKMKVVHSIFNAIDNLTFLKFLKTKKTGVLLNQKRYEK